MGNPIQFKNMVLFDHKESCIETKTIVGNLVENTPYKNTFFSNSSGPLIQNAIIIGNSDSSSQTSITESGMVVAWDRGQLLENISFYNFPDNSSRAIRGPFIIGTCTLVQFLSQQIQILLSA